jgi:hypothetical protein
VFITELRLALTQACRIIRQPAERDPDTGEKPTKECSFKMWMSRESKLAKAAHDLLVLPEDIWKVANGNLPIEEVKRLGTRGGQQDLTLLAQNKKPWLAVEVKRDGDSFNAVVIVVHQGKTIARFGNRRGRTLTEVKDAICRYLTFEFHIYPAKQHWIESEIARLNEMARWKPTSDKCNCEDNIPLTTSARGSTDELSNRNQMDHQR